MNRPAPLDRDAGAESSAHVTLLDRYWDELRQGAHVDPRSWLSEQRVGSPGLADDLEILGLFHQMAVASRSNEDAASEPSWLSARSADRTQLRSPPGRVGRESAADGSVLPRRIGKYAVVEKLGEGGQGEVFRVVHPKLGKNYVLKLARPLSALDSDARDRLGREARLLAQCDHANLVRVVDLDSAGDRPFLVMEHVSGVTLRQFAERRSLGPRYSARLVVELASAVSYLHARGITHQDIKPGNVLIDEHGRPRLIDLGLARLRTAWAEDSIDWVGGTHAYMSPEQALGQVDRVGPWTDVFGLGGVLYELLTGLPLYQGLSRASVLEQARKGDYIPIRAVNPRVPRALERICRKALASDPEARYRTADELAVGLRRFARRRWVAAACAGVLILVTGGLLARGLLPSGLDGPANPAVAGGGSIASGVSPGVSPRITSFDVQHYSRVEPSGKNDELQSIGAIGEFSDETRCEDMLRVLVRFSAPVYCYLIALDPNGRVERCHPADAAVPPRKGDEVAFPERADACFQLSARDGSGLQAFVVLASREPLPAYNEWPHRDGWKWSSGTGDGVWRFDGRWIKRVTREYRGTVTTDTSSPKPFRELCGYLLDLRGFEVREAIVFPVRSGN